MLHTLLYFLALFSLSTSANWAKFSSMPVDVLGFYRLGIAGLLLGVWVFLIKKTPLPRLNSTLLWAFLSGFFFFAHLWTFKYAAKNTLISNSMIIFSSNPVWASLGAVVFFKEKLSLRVFVSYVLAFVGILVLVYPSLQPGHQPNSGDISSFFSAIFYAAYMLSGKKARTYFDNQFYAFIQYTVCALFFLFCVGASGSAFTGYNNSSWFAVLALIALPTFFGHFSFTYLVQHMNLSVMTCGKLVEPVMASIIAAFMFNETLSETAPVAFTFTALSVLVLFGPNLFKNSKDKTSKSSSLDIG